MSCHLKQERMWQVAAQKDGHHMWSTSEQRDNNKKKKNEKTLFI